MSKGYALKHSCIPEVSRGASDPSPASSQQSRTTRHVVQAQKSNSMWDSGKQNADRGQGQMRHMTSPISSLSPPQSSYSSDVLSQCDSDTYRSEITSSSDNSSNKQYHVQVPHKAASSSVESPDSTLAFSGGHSNITDAASMSVNVETLSDNEALIYKLQALETALMGPDVDERELMEFSNEKTGSWEELLGDVLPERQGGPCMPISTILMKAQQEGSAVGASENGFSAFEHLLGASNQCSNVKNLLITCAAALSEGKMDVAELAMQDIRKVASVFGDPSERLAAYMSEGLVARLHASGSTIYKALKCREAPAVEVLSAMQKLYDICPYIQFAFMAANGAIAEAFKEEPMVHVFDFQIDQGTQWFSLIQALASRPGGPPYVRISTVDDSTAHSYPLGGMDAVKMRLASFAGSLGVPFELTTISAKLSELQASMIERRTGEALAINFALQLHHMPDESVSLDNPRDRLIRLCKSLNPKVLTLVEQDANTNTAPFLARFVETLEYYSAVFESIDVALPRESKDRVNVEKHCLARDIVNVIACEGIERVERHELAGKWRARMLMAGFKPHPLSLYVNSAIKSLLESFNGKYRLKEDGEVLLLGWKDRLLLAASAWH